MSLAPGMTASSGFCAGGARPSQALKPSKSLTRLGLGLSEEIGDRLLRFLVFQRRKEAGPQLLETVVAHFANPLSLIEGIQVIDGAAHGAGPNAIMKLNEESERR